MSPRLTAVPGNDRGGLPSICVALFALPYITLPSSVPWLPHAAFHVLSTTAVRGMRAARIFLSTFPIVRCYHCACLPGCQNYKDRRRCSGWLQHIRQSQADGPLTTFCLSQNAQPFFPNDKPRDGVRRERHGALARNRHFGAPVTPFRVAISVCLVFPLTIILSLSSSHHRASSSVTNLPILMTLSAAARLSLCVFPCQSWSSTWRVSALCAGIADALFATPSTHFSAFSTYIPVLYSF